MMNGIPKKVLTLVVVLVAIISIVLLFTPLGSISEECSTVEYSCEDVELVLQDGPIQTGSISGSFDNFNTQNWNAELITGLSFEVSARSPTSEKVSSVTVRFSFTNEDGEVIETDTQSFSTGTASSTIKLEHKSQSFVTNLEYEIVSVEKLRYKHYTK